MTLDTQLRRQLTSAVQDTTVPPGLALGVVAGGRRRRRRRAVAALALASTVVVGGALGTSMIGQPEAGPASSDGVASGADLADPIAFDWAGTLPDGPDAGLPYFAYGKLWSAGRGVDLPASVNPVVGPWAVDGGWIVMVGKEESDLAWAVLSPDGALRDLPPETYRSGLGMARFVVSPDGRQAATEKWLVDLATMTATELPHSPASPDDGSYITEVRPKGFTEQGLVYEAAPYDEGLGSTYLLRQDGSTAEIGLPDNTHIPDSAPGDIAVGYDYAPDNTDTCVRSYRLVDAQWDVDGTGCMGKYLNEALSISPDGRWLITEDLPRVWDLQEGAFVPVDMPREVVTSRDDALVGGIAWESADSFLLPIPDRTSEGLAGPVDFDQFVRVVRCRLSTGACELVDTVENRVVLDGMSSTEFRFAG